MNKKKAKVIYRNVGLGLTAVCRLSDIWIQEHRRVQRMKFEKE